MSGKNTAFSHLSAEQLRAFKDGTLLEENVPAVEAHLQQCVACCDALSDLPEDGFLLRLRRACGNAPTLLRSRLSSTPPPQDTIASPDLPTDAAADETLNLPGFEDVRELGRGGMGVVYAATHCVMGRRVAVKVIHPEFSGNPAAVERFRREARAAARLAHPNIVTAHDAGEAGGRPFLVLEYVEGESLNERLSRLGRLPVAEVCDALRQAALGVQHAHDNGLIHRDLKPHNLMRTEDGTVKVCDFGLAALLNDCGAGSRTTVPNAIMGTPDYMAPEQAEDARSADGRADVYALGCTLYHLLTGQVPFPEESVLLKLVAHRMRARPSLRGARPEIPAELDAVLRRAMARRPQDRFQTPAELAEALSPFSDPARPVLHHRRRRRALRAFALLMLPATLAIAGVMWLSVRNDQLLVIETDDPEIAVVVKGDRIVRIVDPRTGKACRLDRDNLTLGLADDPDGLAITLDGERPLVLKRRGQKIVTLRVERNKDKIVPDSPRHVLLKSGRPLPVGQSVRIEGYDHPVWSVAFSPDGRYTLTSGGRNYLHERLSQRLVRRIGSGIWVAAFSPDGKQALTSDLSMSSVILSRVESGEEIRRIDCLTGGVRDASFSPDGQRIALSEWDSVHVYDAATGQRVMTAPAQSLYRPAFAFTPDSRRLLIIHSDNRSIRTYEVKSGKEAEPPLLSPAPIRALAVSPDGKTVLGTRWELNTDDVFVWDRTSRKLVRRLIAGQRLSDFNHRQVAFLPDSRRALVTNFHGTMILWDVPTGRQLQRWDDLSHIVGLAVSADGRCALCGLYGARALLFRLPDRPASADAAGEPRLFEVRRHTLPLLDSRLPPHTCAAAFSSEGTMYAVGGDDNLVRIWDRRTGELLHTLRGHTHGISRIAFTPDGKRLVSSSEDRTVRLWDTSTGQELKKLPFPKEGATSVDISPNGTHLVCGCADNTARIWDITHFQEAHCLNVGKPCGAVFVGDGKQVAAWSGGDTLTLWEAATGKLLAIKSGPPDSVRDVRTTRGGKTILVAGSEGLSWRDPSTLHEVRNLPCQGLFANLNWGVSPDGRFLIVAFEYEASARLWDLQSGTEIGRLALPSRPSGHVAFSPDGRHLAAGSFRGYAYLLKIEEDAARAARREP